MQNNGQIGNTNAKLIKQNSQSTGIKFKTREKYLNLPTTRKQFQRKAKQQKLKQNKIKQTIDQPKQKQMDVTKSKFNFKMYQKSASQQEQAQKSRLCLVNDTKAKKAMRKKQHDKIYQIPLQKLLRIDHEMSVELRNLNKKQVQKQNIESELYVQEKVLFQADKFVCLDLFCRSFRLVEQKNADRGVDWLKIMRR